MNINETLVSDRETAKENTMYKPISTYTRVEVCRYKGYSVTFYGISYACLELGIVGRKTENEVKRAITRKLKERAHGQR